MKRRTLPERLDALSMPEPNSGCRLWLGNLNATGYGLVWVNRRNRLAHRMSFLCHNGNIPDGLYILHKCDNPGCINPAHLVAGTQVENIADMRAKGRSSDGRPRPSVWGAKNGNSKHSEELMLAVKRASGTYEQIARIYGVSETSVGYVKRGIQWGHLP